MSLIERKKCPICNQKNFKLIYCTSFKNLKINKFLRNHFSKKFPEKIFNNKNYELNECNICNVLFQKYIFSNVYHKKLYEEFVDEEISKKKKLNFSTKNLQNYFNEFRSVENNLKKKPKDIKILEIGAGWGYWSLLAKTCNFDIYSVEISSTRLKYMKKNNLKAFDNVEKLKNKKFDVIYLDQTFEHLQSPYDILKKLRKLLKKGGLFIIKVPSGLFTKRKLNNNYNFQKDEIIPLEHINTFNYKTFNFISKRFGLKILYFFSPYKFTSIKFYKDFIKNILNYYTNKTVIFKKI